MANGTNNLVTMSLLNVIQQENQNYCCEWILLNLNSYVLGSNYRTSKGAVDQTDSLSPKNPPKFCDHKQKGGGEERGRG